MGKAKKQDDLTGSLVIFHSEALDARTYEPVLDALQPYIVMGVTDEGAPTFRIPKGDYVLISPIRLEAVSDKEHVLIASARYQSAPVLVRKLVKLTVPNQA